MTACVTTVAFCPSRRSRLHVCRATDRHPVTQDARMIFLSAKLRLGLKISGAGSFPPPRTRAVRLLKTLIATILCICLFYFQCITMAQAVSQSASIHYAAADVAAFHGNQGMLTNAIHDIRQSTGGRVVEVRCARQNAMLGYRRGERWAGQARVRPLRPNIAQRDPERSAAGLDAQMTATNGCSPS